MQPAAGTPISGKGVVICKYPSDPTVILGYISFAALIASTVVGHMSIFYPYNKRAIPSSALFRSKTMFVFFNIAWYAFFSYFVSSLLLVLLLCLFPSMMILGVPLPLCILFFYTPKLLMQVMSSSVRTSGCNAIDELLIVVSACKPTSLCLMN